MRTVASGNENTAFQSVGPTSVSSALDLEVYLYTIMRYINRRFTYLLKVDYKVYIREHLVQ